MDRVPERLYGAAVVDGDNRFANQLAGAGSDNAAADQPIRRRIDQPLGQAIGSTERMSSTTGGPRKAATR